jgi:hypothetical protein
MPTPEGEFPAITDVLQPERKVRLGAVHAWQTTGYQWAPITLVP